MKSRKKEKNETDDLILKSVDSKLTVIGEKKFFLVWRKLKKMILPIFVFMSLFTFLFLSRVINFNIIRNQWKTTLSISLNTNDIISASYINFKKGIIRYSNDGASYIDENGEIIWNIPFSMNNIICITKNNYVVFANKFSNYFYIFDQNGEINKINTYNEIENISLSNNGILIIVEKDDINTYITKYDILENKYKSMLTTNIDSTGTIIDISISENGTKFLTSNICFDNKFIVKSVYYDIYDDVAVEKNEYISQNENNYLGRIHYFDDKNGFLLFGDEIIFFENDNNINIVNNINFDNKISSIAYDDKYVSIIFENKKIIVYNINGQIVGERNIDFNYENFYIVNNCIIFIDKQNVKIYDKNMRTILDKKFNKNVIYIYLKKGFIFKKAIVGNEENAEMYYVF